MRPHDVSVVTNTTSPAIEGLFWYNSSSNDSNRFPRWARAKVTLLRVCRREWHVTDCDMSMTVCAEWGKEIGLVRLVREIAKTSISFVMLECLSCRPSIHLSALMEQPGSQYKKFNPLNTERRPLYLKTQSVPRCKHFSSGL